MVYIFQKITSNKCWIQKKLLILRFVLNNIYYLAFTHRPCGAFTINSLKPFFIYFCLKFWLIT